MIVSDPPSEILDPQQPYWPADKVSDRVWLRLKGKLTGRPIEQLSGEMHTSYVRLSEADADRLIENIKKYGKYPQVNQNDKYGGAYNNEQYQKWLVEEFLEKPFQQQTNQKVEDAEIESRLKEIQEERSKKAQEKKEKAQAFISGNPSGKLGLGTKRAIKTTIPGVIPKRSVPTTVITSKPKSPEVTSGAELSDSETTFGRLLLNFVQINNDLDAIAEKIEDDFKNTKQKNKEEVDEYRKKIANRGRKLTKKEIKNDKKGVVETIKPFVSNFFSGAGGAIRSLALWKMMMGIMDGDISAVFKGLFGIGLSFLPKIGMMIAGSILKNMAASMLGRAAGSGLSRGVGRAAGSGLSRGVGGGRTPRVASPKMGIGKWAGIASLGAGALALGSAFSSENKDESTTPVSPTGVEESETQKRLEELTAQQKEQKDIGSIAQEDLKKFESLNKKFDMAIDLLLMKPQRNNSASENGGANSSQSTSQTNFPGGDTSGDLSGSENAQKAFNYFLSRGYSKEQSAALVGNFLQENSALDPNVTNSIGHKGIAQWDPTDRYPKLVAFARSKGLNPDSIEANIQFVEHELMTESGGLSKDRLKGTKSVEEAALLVRKQYLRPGEHEANDANRLRQAQNVLSRYGSGAPTPAPAPPSPVQPAPRNDGRRASAGPSAGPSIAVNVVPFSISGNNDPGSMTNAGSELANIDPSNPRNAYAFLTLGELNLVGHG
jgi:ElaB/YqjD/DUF883 family membrane-anchored ribosome-binding protein